MRKPEIVSHKGKSIFYMDFSNLKTIDEIENLINSSKAYIHKQPAHSVLAITNLTGIHFNNEIKSVFSGFISSNKPYVKASAVFGISGLARVVYNGITKLTGRDVKSFDNVNSAKDWLVER